MQPFYFACVEGTQSPALAGEGLGSTGGELRTLCHLCPSFLLPPCLASCPHQMGVRRLLWEVMCFSSWKAEQDCIKEKRINFLGTLSAMSVCVCARLCAHSIASPKHASQNRNGALLVIPSDFKYHLDPLGWSTPPSHYLRFCFGFYF